MARADLYAGTPAAAPLAFTRMTPRLFQSVDVEARTAGSFRASGGNALSLASASASFPCWISALISFSAAACGEPDTLTGIGGGVGRRHGQLGIRRGSRGRRLGSRRRKR